MVGGLADFVKLKLNQNLETEKPRLLLYYSKMIFPRQLWKKSICFVTPVPSPTNVLEEKAQALQHSVLNVKFRYPVLVHQSRQDREGRTRLRYNCYGNGGADPVLALLYLEIV